MNFLLTKYFLSPVKSVGGSGGGDKVVGQLDDSGMCPSSALLLGASQHSLAQGLEVRPPIRLTLQQLQPVDMACKSQR